MQVKSEMKRKHTESLSVRMTDNDMRFFRKICSESMIPQSRIVRRLIRGYLKQEYDRRRLLGQVAS
jgi:hypothetical protein